MESLDFPQWSMNLCGAQSDHDRNRWGAIWHVPQGTIHWRPERARLFLTPEQRRGDSGFNGNIIAKALQTLPALNACALEYLLVRQEAIPAEWRAYSLNFWGTIYQETKGLEFVRCLYWDKDQWRALDMLIDGYGWTRNSAAVLFDKVPTMASCYPERYLQSLEEDTKKDEDATVQRLRCA